MGQISTPTAGEHLVLGASEGHDGALENETNGFAPIRRLRNLEGRCVTVALADGTILNSVTLVSSGRGEVSTLWLEVEDTDLFIDRTQVLEINGQQTPKAA
jgi:hypothetical protein